LAGFKKSKAVTVTAAAAAVGLLLH